MAKTSVVKALIEAVAEEMSRDEKVICIGEDIGKKGGSWGTFTGLQQAFGENRVLEMPIAEQGYATFAIGAASAGYRPVVEFMFADFATLGFEAVADIAAKMRFNSQGKKSCPVTYVFPAGGGMRVGCHHSQSVESWFANVPGLKIVAPTYPEDLKGLFKAAIRDDDPVLFIYPKINIGMSSDIPDGKECYIPLTNAGKVVKEGKDVTVIAWQRALEEATYAAEALEDEGIDVEIIDPRVLIPLDKETILKSVRKTGKVVIAHEAHKRGGYGGEIASIITEECFDALKAPIMRIGAKNGIIPFGPAEDFIYPVEEDIIEAVKKIVK